MYQKQIIVFFSAFITALLVFLGALYIYDPLSLFHTPYFGQKRIHPNMRLQIPGIANTYDFDSIIIGSSMLENTSADEASKLFGGSFANLSIAGSDFFERSLILEHLLEKKDLQAIIYSLDKYYLGQRRGSKSFPLQKYAYLYDNNRLNDLKVYLNTKNMRCLATFSTNKYCVGKTKTLNAPNAWFSEYSVHFGSIDNWFIGKTRKGIKREFKDIIRLSESERGTIATPQNQNGLKDNIKSAITYIDEYIIRHVLENPDIDFHLLFPPYSRIRYSKWYHLAPDKFQIHCAVLRYLTTRSSTLHNLQVYAYGDFDFLDDLANYKDESHFHESINSWLLYAMNEHIGILTEERVEEYIVSITNKARNFNLLALGKIITCYLDNYDFGEAKRNECLIGLDKNLW